MIDFTSIQQMLDDSRETGLPLWKSIQLPYRRHFGASL